MENLSKPKLFRKMYENTCPECGHDTLWLVQYECTKNQLNDQGFIRNTFTDGLQIKLQCANCGMEYHNVEQVGMSYRIKSDLPPIRKVMKDYNPFQS